MLAKRAIAVVAIIASVPYNFVVFHLSCSIERRSVVVLCENKWLSELRFVPRQTNVTNALAWKKHEQRLMQSSKRSERRRQSVNSSSAEAEAEEP